MDNFERLQGATPEPVCVHSKTVMGCPGCTARNKRFAVKAIRERDQLRQQVERLLGAVENHRVFHVGGGLGAFHAAKRRSDEETREVEAQQDRNLWDAADQVRKELGE